MPWDDVFARVDGEVEKEGGEKKGSGAQEEPGSRFAEGRRIDDRQGLKPSLIAETYAALKRRSSTGLHAASEQSKNSPRRLCTSRVCLRSINTLPELNACSHGFAHVDLLFRFFFVCGMGFSDQHVDGGHDEQREYCSNDHAADQHDTDAVSCSGSRAAG
jgi:hypothetical protein